MLVSELRSGKLEQAEALLKLGIRQSNETLFVADTMANQ